MRFDTLNGWLAWQETLHPNPIDLGLQRVAAVWCELRPEGLGCKVISVAGTNGKGSCVALAESIALEGGVITGAFTSPHLLRYTERIRLNGKEVGDEMLCAAFERIDQARQRCFNADGSVVTLSYFEFATLAALECFAEACVELAILEVGLGGRLDAVNIIDADAAVISSIGIDHVAWLGADIDVIGSEKAGIARADKPLVLAMLAPPKGLLTTATELGADILTIGEAFTAEKTAQGWNYQRGSQHYELPLPALGGEFQRRHAAAVITALHEISELPELEAIRAGLQKVAVTARQQRLSVVNKSGQTIQVLVDVAHNADSAAELAANTGNVTGKRIAVVGILADKSLDDIVQPMLPIVDEWICCTPDNPRALAASELAAQMAKQFSINAKTIESAEQAVSMALDDLRVGDELCVFGSFYTVAPALPFLLGKATS